MRRAVKHTVFTLLFLILCLSTALFAYLYFFQPGDRDLSGEWTAELDMTEQAAATALGWLQDIEGVTVSLEEVESYMDDLTIRVNLTFQETARSEGTFRCSILPESYDACRQAAYEAFAAAFHALLADRLRMAGYTGGTEREDMEILVNETFGMSTVSYLMTCGPALLPSLEEMQEGYDGSGTYTAAEGVLNREFDAGGRVNAKEEKYIRKGENLILSGGTGDAVSAWYMEHYPILYTLGQSEDR